MADIYCAKKRKFIPEEEINKEHCEETCSMFDTCFTEVSADEATDPDFAFSEEEDWDDDSDINNHEDEDDD